MIKWRKYDYVSIDQVRNDIEELGLNLPLSDRFEVLFEPLELYGKKIRNRIAIQPMEGFDGFPDGTPRDFTFRKY